MPNWIEGTMKLRGKMMDVKKFFDLGLDASSWGNEPTDINDQRIDNSRLDLGYIDYSFKDEPHVKGTRRMFITDESAWMDEDDEICCVNIKQAWDFSHDEDLETLINIADTYQLDIRLYGIECGMEFCQELIILHGDSEHKGVIHSIQETKYKDWMWECPFPRMGG